MSIERVGGQNQPLTSDQQQALKKLHDAAQQMESLFVDMLFKEMRKTSPPTSLAGKVSNAEQTFGEMLDSKRADELAKTGALGIGAILEQQMRASVLGTAPQAPTVNPATTSTPSAPEKREE